MPWPKLKKKNKRQRVYKTQYKKTYKCDERPIYRIHIKYQYRMNKQMWYDCR